MSGESCSKRLLSGHCAGLQHSSPSGTGVDREGPEEPGLPRSAPQQPGPGTFGTGPGPPPHLSSLRMGDQPWPGHAPLLPPSGESPGGWGRAVHAAGRAPGHGQDNPPPAVSGWGQPAQSCCGHIVPRPASESPSHSGDPSPGALAAAAPWGSSKCPHCLPRSPTGQSPQVTVLAIHPLRTPPHTHTGPSLRPCCFSGGGSRGQGLPPLNPHPSPHAVGPSLSLWVAGGAQGL